MVLGIGEGLSRMRRVRCGRWGVRDASDRVGRVLRMGPTVYACVVLCGSVQETRHVLDTGNEVCAVKRVKPDENARLRKQGPG